MSRPEIDALKALRDLVPNAPQRSLATAINTNRMWLIRQYVPNWHNGEIRNQIYQLGPAAAGTSGWWTIYGRIRRVDKANKAEEPTAAAAA